MGQRQGRVSPTLVLPIRPEGHATTSDAVCRHDDRVGPELWIAPPTPFCPGEQANGVGCSDQSVPNLEGQSEVSPPMTATTTSPLYHRQEDKDMPRSAHQPPLERPTQTSTWKLALTTSLITSHSNINVVAGSATLGGGAMNQTEAPVEHRTPVNKTTDENVYPRVEAQSSHI
ncbi:hypothetical protein PSHT_05905 [Puccinia striiformis]|uniref:Uncharacterized protein n=1 Tax=Puccinia striiformis TaxID=27350 RepID=A0A2S4W989_9BASI|nr:hypothetical protein PSHT_05905 [Puccinia striiformis]